MPRVFGTGYPLVSIYICSPDMPTWSNHMYPVLSGYCTLVGLIPEKCLTLDIVPLISAFTRQLVTHKI